LMSCARMEQTSPICRENRRIGGGFGDSEHRVAPTTNKFKTTHPSIRSRGNYPH
jgi:hypothetical protein